MENKYKSVWIFHGENAQFASAVFFQLEKAQSWIYENKVSGILTEYPVDISCYDWAKKNNFYIPQNSDAKKKKMQKFTSYEQKHFHYNNGDLE